MMVILPDSYAGSRIQANDFDQSIEYFYRFQRFLRLRELLFCRFGLLMAWRLDQINTAIPARIIGIDSH